MKLIKKIGILCLVMVLSKEVTSQQPSIKPLRVVDSITADDKKSGNRVILRAELDSLIIKFQQPQIKQADPDVKSEPIQKDNSNLILPLLFFIIALVLGLIFLVYRQQSKWSREFNSQEEGGSEEKKEQITASGSVVKKTKLSAQALENRISDLKAELLKLSRENEGMNRVIKEYNGIQHEYDSIKHGILKSYKVKNYPGYDKSKNETAAMQGVLLTENAVAAYAFEKFLKPILVITDANKNSPARTSATDREKLINLLVSLSLLYIEYLYLRVNDLSIGGKMVERIQGFSKGNGIDTGLLKKLDTEFGSRALVIKMALKNAGLEKLIYPVFDETNLNN